MPQEQPVKIKLSERQMVAGAYYDAGETVTVYESEADSRVNAGRAERVSGAKRRSENGS